jgi:hypothetical protein
MGRVERPSKNPHRRIKSRPVRTREHVIADLSVLHFQWIAANAGHVTEVPEHDYGYDLILNTFTDDGKAESGWICLQFKATDDFDRYVLSDGTTVSFPIERQYIELWRNEPMPVILVIYDAKRERSYWLYIQEYFQSGKYTRFGCVK